MWASALILATAAQAGAVVSDPARIVTPAPPPSPAIDVKPPPGASPALVEAYANLARVKVKPRAVKRGALDYPAAEKAVGATGVVLIRGIVLADGSLAEATVARSSGNVAFDAAALKAAQATTYSAATDAGGQPLATPITNNYRFAMAEGQPSNIERYADAPYPDADRAAGRHGKVVIEGMIGPDGRMIDPKITASSRAPTLDDVALAGARGTLFRVAKAEAGVTPKPTQIAYEFVSYRLQGKGGGVLRYRCAQFVLDQDWWKATWEPPKRTEFESMMGGLGFLVLMQGRWNGASFKAWSDGFKARFAGAIEDCRAKPDALAIDMIKPEGVYARRLAERGGL
jgi:TonB family protein